MSIDHGVLNVPLSKRGDIHREIDKLKAAHAADHKDRMRRLREAQKAVKQINRVLVDLTWGDPAGTLQLAKDIGDLIARFESSQGEKL